MSTLSIKIIQCMKSFKILEFLWSENIKCNKYIMIIIYFCRPTNDTDKFGRSWRVGGKKACGRDYDKTNKTMECSQNSTKRENKERCLKIKSKVFEACHKKINDGPYLR